MDDKDKKRSALGSSVSGIPTRVSRLPTPAARSQLSSSTLGPPSIPGPPRTASTRNPVVSGAKSSSNLRAAATLNSAASSSTTSAARSVSSSSSSIRAQKSNPSLRTQSSRTSLKVPMTSVPASSTSRAATASLRSQKSTSSLKPLVLDTNGPSTPQRKPSPLSAASASKTKASSQPPVDQEQGGAERSAPLSLKEQIAARRAAMKKVAAVVPSSGASVSASVSKGSRTSSLAVSSSGGSGFSDWDSLGPNDTPNSSRFSALTGAGDSADDLLGRPSVNSTIVKALNSGNLNLISRQLGALPGALFQIHLGVDPKPLAGQSPSSPTKEMSSAGNRWEAVDLTVLKAGDNEIVELQEEIGLFGSLKTIDLQRNKLAQLPESFLDLISLIHVDLSGNRFTSIPSVLSSLPALLTLNLSNNLITSLSITLPDAEATERRRRESDFYRLDAARSAKGAEVPFPTLQSLLLAGNKIVAGEGLEAEMLPRNLVKIDLNSNPLGPFSGKLLRSLGGLLYLKEVHMRLTGPRGLDDASLQHAFSGAHDSSSTSLYPVISVLDLGDNEKLTEDCVRRTLLSSFAEEGRNIIVGTHLDQLRARVPPTSANERTIRLVIGKHVIKEAWEQEVEERAKRLKSSLRGRPAEFDASEENGAQQDGRARDGAVSTEGGGSLGLGFGAKEARVRRTGFGNGAKKPTTGISDWDEPYTAPGLLSASKTKSASNPEETARPVATSPPPEPNPLNKHYDDKTRTLALPSAIPLSGRNRLPAKADSNSSDVPVMTLPHSLIISHPWSASLKVLTLSNRRADVLFLLGCSSNEKGHHERALDSAVQLPSVEELMLDGCQLPSSVRTRFVPASALTSSPASSESEAEGEDTVETQKSLFATLGRLFPSLRRLDLSYNVLTTLDGVEPLFYPPPPSADPTTNGDKANGRGIGNSGVVKGLKVLRVRGNKIKEDGLGDLVRLGEGVRARQKKQVVSRSVPADGSSSAAEAGSVEGASINLAAEGEDTDAGLGELGKEWKGEEIDLRENEIAKLPGMLGWLPTDILLVEGNLFRVPNRRVWERDGSKGLLNWLKETAP